jgi:hypothetical protein
MGKKPGSYLGTEIEGKWWKRYREDGFFARGNGEWWIENGALCFRRLMTRTPLVIPFDEVTEVKIGTWHAGRWILGRPIFKILWSRKGLRLSSGFYLEGDRRRAMELLGIFESWVQQARERKGFSTATDSSGRGA